MKHNGHTSNRTFRYGALVARRAWKVVLVCLVGFGAFAQPRLTEGPPELVSYQGTLHLASDGVTPVSSSADFEFRLYRNSNDPIGSAIWGEKHEDVAILNGIFNVYLGAGDAIPSVPNGSIADAFKETPLWLGIKAGLDNELAERQRITSAPFAMTAKHVSKATHGAPVGTMMMFAGPTAPAGWVFCNGQSLNASAQGSPYADLWAAIGTTWGGTGITSFNVPDMRGMTPIGHGAGIDANTDTGHGGATAGLQVRPVGTATGSETHTLTVDELPAHTHTYTDRHLGTRASGNRFGGLSNAADGASDGAKNTSFTGGGGAHNNVQPSMYINFIIKL